MPLGEVLVGLEPLEQQAVDLVYFQGHSTTDAARLLAVEQGALVAALSAAFRRIARWLHDEDDHDHGPTHRGHGTTAAARHGIPA